MFDSLQALLSATCGVAATGGAGYAALSLAVAHRFTTARRAATGPTPQQMGLAHEDVRLHSRSDGIRLAAWYLRAQAPRGAVILVHGRGASKGNEFHTQSMQLVRSLLDKHLSVLMLDLRGHGDSDPARLTYGCNERFDVLGAVDWLRERGYRPGRIGVLGASMGGSAAIAAAAEEPAIGALVSDSAFADFGAVLRHNFPRVMRTRLSLGLLPGALWVVQRMTGVALHRFRPADMAERLKQLPFLLIHSRGDRFITVDHAHDLARMSGAQAWLSDTAEHVGTFEAQPGEYIERVTDFFGRTLTPAAA